MISIRGHELPFSFSNIDRVKSYAAAYRVMEAGASEGLARIQGCETLEDMAEVLEALYKALDDFFSVQFGEGTLGTILGGERDVMEALDAFYDLRDAALENNAARASMTSARAVIPDKYNPDNTRK